MTKKKNTALVVCTMHRSGSSALTRTFNILGYGVSESQIGINATNETGHWESRHIARLNDKILSEYQSDWRDWKPLMHGSVSNKDLQSFKIDIQNTIKDDFNIREDFIIKDPRICRLTDLYISSLENLQLTPKVINLYRNPIEVMNSLEKRNQINPIQGGFLWLRYVLDAEFATRKVERVFISYDSLLGSPKSAITNIISNLDLEPKFDFKSLKKEIKKTITEKRRHHKISAEEVALNPLTKSYISQAYAALKVLEANPKEKTALTEMDRIRDEFNRNSHLFDALINITSQNYSKTHIEKTIHEATLETAQTNQKMSEKLSEDIANYTDQINEKNSELEQSQKQLQDAQAQVKQLSDTLETNTKSLNEIEVLLVKERNEFHSGLQAQATTSATQDKNYEEQLAQSQKQLEDAQAQVKQLSNTLETNTKSLTEIEALLVKERNEFHSALQAQSTASETQNENYEEQLTQSQKQLEGAQAQVKQLNDTLETNTNSLNEIEALLVKERNEFHNELQAQSTASETQNKDHEEQLAQSQKQLEDAQAQVKQLNDALETNTKSLIEIEALLVKERDKFHNGLQAQATTSATQNENYEEQLVRGQKELNEAQKKITHYINLIADYKERISLTETTARNRQETLQTLEGRLANKEGELSQLEATLSQKGESYNNLLKKLSDQESNLLKEISTLKEQSKNINKAHSKLELQANELKAVVKTKEKNLDKTLSEIKERDKALKTQRHTIRSLQKQNWQLQDRLSVTNDNLQELLHSSSWMLTRPLRVVKRLITRQPLRPVNTPQSHQKLQSQTTNLSHKKPQKAPDNRLEGIKNIEALSDKEVIEKSKLFDKSYYIAHYPDTQVSDLSPLDHFLDIGWKKGYQPNPSFNVAAYLVANKEVKENDLNPYAHYLRKLHKNKTTSGSSHQENALKGLGKIAIFGAISGGYDGLKEPLVKTPNADYFMFSDQPIPAESIWKQKQFEFISADPTRTARFIKTHPHIYFPDYDWAIWVDANLQINADLRTIIAEHQNKLDIMTWHHPLRDCVYEEAKECIKRSKDNNDVIETQISRYKNAGLPRNNGLWETSVFVSKMGNTKVVDFMNNWWAEILQGCRRDQIGLPEALRKSDVEIGGFVHQGICMRTDERFNYFRHTPNF